MKQVGKTKRYLSIIICILMVLFLGIIGHSCGQELAVSEYENQVDKIKEIDNSKKQEELNLIVEKGKMNVNYSPTAVFKGKISESFNVKNIQNNHYPIIFELYDEGGESLYLSKKIEPGYEINQIELNRELPKGTHECKIKVGYAEEGNVSSAFPITIEVK